MLATLLATGVILAACDANPVALHGHGDVDEWDNVLENVSFDEDVIVPDGEKWLIGANVRIAGNLRTSGGTIAMRPGSSLHFIGADPDRYVGGGMSYEDAFADDIGLWVGHHGVLDIRGTRKTGWNRTGVDSTWDPDDEYWISPTEVGDYSPRRWYPGDPIPQVDPRAPAAEVMNVTRDIVIEGPGHIHIHSNKPQRIEYVTLRGLGIAAPHFDGSGLLSGRYAIHIHMMGDRSRGTVVRGVAAVESPGRVFVPHGSHGITFIDNVSVNSMGEAFWWDHNRDERGLGDRSDDILVDGLAVSGVHRPRDMFGSTSRVSGIELVGGDNLEIRNSVASGVWGSDQSNGFNWPSAGDNHGPAEWKFHGNLAHNNQGAGLRFWFNNRAPHLVENTVTYRNGLTGFETGAYTNSIRYRKILSLEDGTRKEGSGAGIVHHSSTKESQTDERGTFYEQVQIHASGGPAIKVGRLRGTADLRVEWIDCTLESPGYPKVSVGSDAHNPFLALFRNCGDLTPNDIVFEDVTSDMEGTSVIIEHPDGRRWEIVIEDRKRVVREF